jgi:hypothetical protein
MSCRVQGSGFEVPGSGVSKLRAYVGRPQPLPTSPRAQRVVTDSSPKWARRLQVGRRETRGRVWFYKKERIPVSSFCGGRFKIPGSIPSPPEVLRPGGERGRVCICALRAIFCEGTLSLSKKASEVCRINPPPRGPLCPVVLPRWARDPQAWGQGRGCSRC